MVELARQAAQFGNESILNRFGAENSAALTSAQFGQQGQAATNAALAQQAGFQNQARQQGMGELFALRNQPLNEITALLSGSQVQNPAQMGAATPQTGVGGVDYTGLVNQKYQSELASSQAAMGGLFGLLSAPFAMFGASDRRLKRAIERIGTLVNGLPWYRFNYIWDAPDAPPRKGLMSDDVRKKVPEAVSTDWLGFDRVNYTMAMGAA